MPSRRTLVISVLLALTITLSGCSALQGGGNVDADAVAQQTTTAIQDVESYSYNSTVTVQANGQSSTINLTTAVDLAEQRLRQVQTTQGQSVTQYIVGNTAYVQQGGTWSQQNVSELNVWTEQHSLVQQRQMLDSSNVSFAGNTTIDGQDVYELSVDVTEGQFMDMIERQLGQNLSAQTSVDDISYTMYVTHAEHRPKRVTSDITMSAQGQSQDLSTEVTYSYDDVAIELPPEAQNAQSAN